ncbi:MAG: hypothetical protein RLZZ350_25 [Verrucomicrobiota bacterium]|jgi:hypothetical protein
MDVTEIDALTARLEKLPRDDMDAAVYLTRDVLVFARKIFGEESPHVAEVQSVSFRTKGFIYNTGHYMNTAAWNDGSRNLGAVLKSMRYEASLMSKPELQPPEKITLPWLWHHLSWQVWLSFISLLVLALSAGFFAGRVNLFVQIYKFVIKQ